MDDFTPKECRAFDDRMSKLRWNLHTFYENGRRRRLGAFNREIDRRIKARNKILRDERNRFEAEIIKLS